MKTNQSYWNFRKSFPQNFKPIKIFVYLKVPFLQQRELISFFYKRSKMIF